MSTALSGLTRTLALILPTTLASSEDALGNVKVPAVADSLWPYLAIIVTREPVASCADRLC